MTKDEYDLFLELSEPCMILFQTVILLVLWKIVFRTGREKTAIAAAILFAIISLAARLPFTTPVVRYIMSVLFAEGYCFMRYRKNYAKAAFVLLLYYNFHTVSALISISLSQILQNHMFQELQKALDKKLQNVMPADLERVENQFMSRIFSNTIVYGVIFYLAYLLIFLFIVFLFAKIFKNAREMDWRDAVIFSVYSLSAGILLSIVNDLYAVQVGDAVFYLYDTKKEMFWKIPLVAGCIFAGEILLIYFWQNYRVLLEERQKHDREEQQIKAIRQRLMEAEDFYGNIRKVRHEMKNHMANVKGLAALKQYEEIAGYIQKIDESMQELEYQYVTGNAVTDVIVNDKWRRAQRLGIRFEAEFQYTGEIPAFDVGMILSNLLDNAIEACEKVVQGKRFIQVALLRKKQFLLIDVKNSFDGNINWQDNEKLPRSTKESHVPELIMEHGIGLKNVQDIAERYYGGVNIKVKENVFHITVMLQQERKTLC